MSQHQNTPSIYQHKQLLWFTFAIVMAITAAIVISLALMSYMVKTQVAAVLAAQQTQARAMPAATLAHATEEDFGPSCSPVADVVSSNLANTPAPSTPAPVTNRWVTDNSTHTSTVDTRSFNTNLTNTLFENSFNNSLNNTDSNNQGSNNTVSGDLTQSGSNNSSTTNTTDASGTGNTVNGSNAPVIPVAPVVSTNPVIIPNNQPPAIVE